MTIKVQHKRSAVKGKVPLPTDLEYGEIAVNYEATDPALYVKDSADAVRRIGGGGGGSAGVHVGETPPANPKQGQEWFHSGKGKLYIYYDDGVGAAQWVVASPSETGPAGPLGSIGPTGIQGPAGTGVKAWVNFNSIGTIAIRASFNVSSITDGGIGVYTVNFTTAFADADYATFIGGSIQGAGGVGTVTGGFYGGLARASLPKVGSVPIETFNYAVAAADSLVVNVAIFH